MSARRAMDRRAEALIHRIMGVLTITGGITMPPATGRRVVRAGRIASALGALGRTFQLPRRGLLRLSGYLPGHQHVVPYLFVTNPMQLERITHPFNSDAAKTWFVPTG